MHVLSKHDGGFRKEFGNGPIVNSSVCRLSFRPGDKVHEIGAMVRRIHDATPTTGILEQATGDLLWKERSHNGVGAFGLTHDAILLTTHIAIVKQKENNGKEKARAGANRKDKRRIALVTIFIDPRGVHGNLVRTGDHAVALGSHGKAAQDTRHSARLVGRIVKIPIPDKDHVCALNVVGVLLTTRVHHHRDSGRRRGEDLYAEKGRENV